jgi:hypothetical protein
MEDIIKKLESYGSLNARRPEIRLKAELVDIFDMKEYIPYDIITGNYDYDRMAESDDELQEQGRDLYDIRLEIPSERVLYVMKYSKEYLLEDEE